MTSANDPYQPPAAPPGEPSGAYQGGFQNAPGSSSYGGGPGGPGGHGGPVEKPASVATAVKLMFARAALTLLAILLSFTQRDALREALTKGQPGLGPAQLDSAISAALTVGAVVGVIFTVLYVLLALQVGKGKNWARIVTFIVAGLGILGSLIGLFGAAPALSKIIGVITLLLDIAIVFFLSKANDWFNRTA